MNSLLNFWHKSVASAASVLIILLGFSLFMQDADARRIGGGKSFGRQSQNVTRQAAPPQQPSQNAATTPAPSPAAAPKPAGSRWTGVLGGLAAGLGISALLSHFGLMGPFASALGSVLTIGLIILAGVLLWRLFAARGSAPPDRAPPIFRPQPGPALQSAAAAGSSTNVYGAPLQGSSAAASPGEASSWTVPEDFDVAAFLRNAKVYFVRLQAAWDARDFEDIRRFTTPEVFAEIKMQKDEAAGAANKTDIEQLDATLLGIETTPTEYLASVRFTGTLREDGAAASFEEVWNLVKPVDGRSGWLLAGIQQVH